MFTIHGKFSPDIFPSVFGIHITRTRTSLLQLEEEEKEEEEKEEEEGEKDEAEEAEEAEEKEIRGCRKVDGERSEERGIEKA